MVREKRALYDHNVDQQDFKWSGKTLLQKTGHSSLPSHVANNLEKYKDWIE